MNDQRIAIITDSGTDTDPELIEKYDVRVIPLRIIYSDGKTYESGVDITTEEVISRFAEEIPSTSLPSPKQIEATFLKAKEDGYNKALVVCISSALSATYQTMHMIAESIEGMDIELIDTKNIGMVAGMVVARAIELIEAKVPFEKLAQKLEDVVADSRIFFAAKSLEYLYKGGRINKHIYRIGSVLNVKPLITCDEEGKYVMAKKVRGWEKAQDAMVKLLAERANALEKVHLSICVSPTTDYLYGSLEERVRAAVTSEIVSLKKAEISADLLVHTGPDLFGMGVQAAYTIG